MPATLAAHGAGAAERYLRDGYLLLPGLFAADEAAAAADEADRLLRECHDLIHTDNLRCRWQNHVETGECLFETFDPVIDLSPACAAVARAPRILGALAPLLGGPACLFKDKLIYKPPGARGYDLHQDYIAFPGFPRSFTTVVVALDPCGPDNGCTEVFPGYHRQGCLSPEDGNYHPLPAGTVDEADAVPLVLKPGDAAVFGCFTPHRSAPNRSGRWRRQLYLSYNALADGGDQRDGHYWYFLDWLRQRYAEYGKVSTYFR
jgi:hypothetical protein